MLTLRRDSFRAFRRAGREELLRRASAHLREHFPETCERLGPNGLRRAVRQGLGRARSYGILAERGVVKYLNLMFLFGRDFDRDPSLPWARPILLEESEPPGMLKIERLYRAARRHADQARGYDAAPEDAE